MRYILFIIGLLSWVWFAYDIENDRDFMTWIWLLTSLFFFVNSYVRYKYDMENLNESKKYSTQDINKIVLELENAALYANSHKLSRFELRDKLKAIKEKWKLKD